MSGMVDVLPFVPALIGQLVDIREAAEWAVMLMTFDRRVLCTYDALAKKASSDS